MAIGNYIGMFFNAIFNPVTIVSIAAPTIMNINLLYLRDGLTRSSDAWQETLLHSIDDMNVLAIIDYRTQFYTLLLVTIFYISQNFRFYWLEFFGKHTGNEAIKKLSQDTRAIIHLFCVVIVVIIVLSFAFSGKLGGPELIEEYLKQSGEIDIMSIPPYNSFITWLRVVFILMGIYTAGFTRSYNKT